MEVTNRLKEASKQVRLVKQEVEDDGVSQELEDGLEALQNALEALEEDNN
ncbi:hypothetical protein Harman_23540 [Haloarcula mannanilytica]|uniref:Uncharacterized protein n=1 Tax=Haloarcula mannanilytica TaxID=2509225 RepID=A0A4C2EQG7_9EURY|nr:hypothetical protein [Haloarcula mannanilytica]GCF14419.1 hypothetical protein Harman_23540 [Haloarcula mannanilytica]